MPPRRRPTGARNSPGATRSGGARSERPVVGELRRRCLAFPESTETQSFGHPNFRAAKKTFCTFEIVGGRPSIAFRLSDTDVKAALRKPAFFETPYGRGRWVSLWVDDSVDWSIVGGLLDAAYRQVANKRLMEQLGPRTARPKR